ncbi:MAG TPA: hypothetical protein VJ874_02835 [Candidatus Thermoplasmatota archaeon]|nr:hypothetical protein [Candidatus Thermoplasmatota archaeon]
MAALRALLACLVLASLASGCISDTTSSVTGMPDAADPPQGSRAGSPTAHGAPDRDEGSVDASPEGGQFVARRTVTIANDFGGASRSDLVLKSFNGGIALEPSTDGGYRLVAELYGRGTTQDEARQALDLLTLTNTDDLRQGTLALSFVLASGTPGAFPLPIGLPNGVSNGATFHLAVPAEPSHQIEVASSNGGIATERLHGSRLSADSSNGGISVDGAFAALALQTSNAGLSIDGTFHDVVGRTSNGGISADLRPTRSGSVDLSTSNAGIHVDVPRDESAFDITAATSNAEVRFDLEGRESEGDDHGTFRSGDWSSAGVKVTMELGTSNASIAVED